MNRAKQRANRRLKHFEEKLDIRNAYGIKDPTPKQAVDLIIRKERINHDERRA